MSFHKLSLIYRILKKIKYINKQSKLLAYLYIFRKIYKLINKKSK